MASRRGRWTAFELHALDRALAAHGCDWKAVAAAVKSRGKGQVQRKTRQMSTTKLRRLLSKTEVTRPAAADHHATSEMIDDSEYLVRLCRKLAVDPVALARDGYAVVTPPLSATNNVNSVLEGVAASAGGESDLLSRGKTLWRKSDPNNVSSETVAGVGLEHTRALQVSRQPRRAAGSSRDRDHPLGAGAGPTAGGGAAAGVVRRARCPEAGGQCSRAARPGAPPPLPSPPLPCGPTPPPPLPHRTRSPAPIPASSTS